MPDMFRTSSEYADTLRNNKVRYLPSCVIVELMTRLYTEIIAVNHSGGLKGAVDRILPLLARMGDDLRATREAYGAQVRFFVGDWGDDKLRARRQFFNIMSRLGYVAAMAGHDDRERLHGACEGLTEEWIVLVRTMDNQTKRLGAGGVCRYFRSRNSSTWKQTMANIILTLDEDSHCGEGECLILVCYEKMRRLLLSSIDEIMRMRGRPGGFPAGRILSVSDENVPFSCLTCLEMAGGGGRSAGEKYPESVYAEAIAKMKGASCPARTGPESGKRPGRSPDTVLARLRARVRGAP